MLTDWVASNANRLGSRAIHISRQVTAVLLAYEKDYSLGILPSWKCRNNTKIQISEFKTVIFFLVWKLYGKANLI